MSTSTDRSPVKAGQIYRSCTPRDMGFRIRIVEVGAASVRAVDASNGRPLLRRVLVSALHDGPVTATGSRRRAGYVLDSDEITSVGPVRPDEEPTP